MSVPPTDPQKLPADPTADWLAALLRASSELLANYVISGRAPRIPEGASNTAHFITTELAGSASGQLRCKIDPALALAIAEGMWSEPLEAIRKDQVEDAIRELCGQIVGHAIGEVGTPFTGVVFTPPALGTSTTGPPQGHDGSEAPHGLVPTRTGDLTWEVHRLTLAKAEPQGQAQSQLHIIRERIRSLRDTDLHLLKAVQVLSVDEAADDAFEKLLKLVSSDPAMAARILRRVNSATVRPLGSRIRTLPQALIFLGTRATKNIVVSALLAQPIRGAHPGRRAIIDHCLRVAYVARLFGHASRCEQEECYLLGLLHDLGRLVLERLYPEDLLRIGNNDDEGTLLCRESQVLGLTHAEAGAIVALAWRLPDSIRLVMTLHHDMALLSQLDEMALPKDDVRLFHVVSQADQVVDVWERLGPEPALSACGAASKVLSASRVDLEEALTVAFKHFSQEGHREEVL